MADHSDSRDLEAGASRLRNFLQHEREGGLHPAIKALHERPSTRNEDANRRAVEYARIARGHNV